MQAQNKPSPPLSRHIHLHLPPPLSTQSVPPFKLQPSLYYFVPILQTSFSSNFSALIHRPLLSFQLSAIHHHLLFTYQWLTGGDGQDVTSTDSSTSHTLLCSSSTSKQGYGIPRLRTDEKFNPTKLLKHHPSLSSQIPSFIPCKQIASSNAL